MSAKSANSKKSANHHPVALANRNPFADPAFLREFAATRARYVFPYPVSRRDSNFVSLEEFKSPFQYRPT